MQTAINERGGHKKGCQCNFCKNLGSFGKKKKDDEAESKETKEPTAESIVDKLLDEN